MRMPTGVLIVALSVAALGPTQDGPATTLEGLLTDVSGREPVPGALVELVSVVEGDAVATVESAPDGRYRFVDIRPGPYHVTVTLRGFLPFDTRTRGDRLPVDVPPPGAEANFALSRGATIRGRVSDSTGAPVAGTIWVERDLYAFGERRLYTPRGLPIEEDGTFVLPLVPEGNYYVAAVLDGSSSIYHPGTVDPNAAAVVRVSSAMAERAEIVEGVQIRWHPVPVVPVRGTVVGVGDPENFLVSVSQTLPTNSGGLAGPDGSFELFVPPDREYELVAMRVARIDEERYSLRVPSPAATVNRVYVGAGGAESVVLTVFGSIEVAVDIGWELLPTPGFELDDARVDLLLGFDTTAVMIATGIPILPRIGRQEGSGTLAALAGVPQRLMVRGLPEGVYVASADHAGRDPLVGLWNPAGNSGAPLRIRLGNQPGQITGTVVEPGSDPVAGAVVTLVPDADQRGRSDLFQNIRSDGEGRFAFETVAPGTYLVFGWNSIPAGAIENETFRLPYEPRATRVYVDRLGSADVEVALIE